MTKRKIKKLRRRRRLTIILIIIIVFCVVKFNKKQEIINSSKSYLNNITNSTKIDLKEEYKNIIVSYLDLYTDSLVNLKSRDISKLFYDANSNEAYLSQSIIDLLVFHNSIQINDMKMDKAYYDIELINIKETNDKVIIDFKENDYYNFSYLDNITSSMTNIDNTIILVNDNSEYKIDSIRVTRDNYVIFTNVLDDNFTKNDIDILKNKYKKLFEEEVNNNKKLLEYASNNKYKETKKCDHTYDRNKAVSYSYKYINDRNDYYLDYSNLGGNCANFASQSIHEGGIPMDYSGYEEWKYFSDELNDENLKKGRSSSWVSTYYFYDYAKNNTGYGLCSEVDVNIYYAQIGDIIHVGYKDDTKFSHTTLVSKVIKKDNKVIDILVNSNTTNLKDYPVFAYIYQNKRLIKILGYND